MYGPGEKAITQRTFDNLANDFYRRFAFYVSDLKLDFVHIRNVIQAHIKALEDLAKPDSKAAGEILNITDDEPCDPSFMLTPMNQMIRGEDYTLDGTIALWPLARLVAFLFCFLSTVFGTYFKLPSWGMTWMEIHKVSSD